MRRPILVIGACLTAVASALGLSALTSGAQAGTDRDSARALLRDAAGHRVGSVRITEDEGHVRVRVAVRGLPPGFHGFHVHAVGQCVPPFTSAGAHLSSNRTSHGQHAGDMPVLYVMKNGTGEMRFATDRFTLRQLFDADGSAIIVHAAANNYANIPTRYHSHTTGAFGPDTETLNTGDSGARIACGVVKESPGRDVESRRQQ